MSTGADFIEPERACREHCRVPRDRYPARAQ